MSSVGKLCENSLESVIQEYGVDVDATVPITLKRTQMPKEMRIYQVEGEGVTTYLVDTPMTRRIACHPHVVGKELESLSMEAGENPTCHPRIR